MTVNYLVTGAGRGIGLSIILELAQRSDVKVFGTVRDTAKATALREAAAKYGNVTVLTWRADVPDDSAKLADAVRKEVGRLDVVIANAGVSTEPAPVLTTSIDALLQDVTVNTAGPLHLFQAVYPLLEKSTFSGGGVFMPISSVVGSIADCPPFFVAGYGASKAALNFIGKRIAAEHENIRVLLVHPGVVKTDMGREVLEKLGITDEIPGAITPAESAASIVDLVDTAEKYSSGAFINQKGEPIAY